jgi:hypothetical protein
VRALRRRLPAVLLALGTVGLVLTLLAGYADRAVFNSEQFANRATDALRDERLRDRLATDVTDELVKNEPDLIAARPLIESVAGAVIASGAFADLFHAAVEDLHRAVFKGDSDTVTLTLADAAVVIGDALRVVRPKLADQVEKVGSIRLLDEDLGAATADLTRLAEKVQLLFILLLVVTLGLFAAAIALAADRRNAVWRAAVCVAGAGVLVLLAYSIAHAAVLAGFDDPSSREAADAVWDAFLSDLRRAAWVLTLSGAVLAGAAASVIRPVELEESLARLWAVVSGEPEARWARVLRGLALVAAGILVLVQRDAFIQLVVALVGAYLVYLGLSVLLRLVYVAPREGQVVGTRLSRGQVLRRVGAAGICALLILSAGGALVATGGTSAPGLELEGCNGLEELCDKPLPEVVLPATHNAMSVPLPGWYSAEQDAPIPNQLADGIRGLLIDTHYGDKLEDGKVRTYFTSNSKLTQAVEKDGVSQQGIEAAERLRERLGFSGKGERGLYLCHTFCELGATPLPDVLSEINQFLVANPHEVLVVINEDYVKPEDFVAAVKDAGLADLAYRGPTGESWPTLREMIESDQRLVLLAENEAGAAPWYRPAYKSITEETPYEFKKVSDLTDPDGLERTCRPNRGPEGAPIFLMNHWISTDPLPLPSNAAKVNAREPLLRRARTCERVRDHLPNLLAVNFYRRGDLFGVVEEINREPR